VDFSTARQQLHRALLVYPTHTLSARNVPQSMSFSNRQLQVNNWSRLESNSQRSERIPLTLSGRQRGASRASCWPVFVCRHCSRCGSLIFFDLGFVPPKIQCGNCLGRRFEGLG
jgi:hypothetical protein